MFIKHLLFVGYWADYWEYFKKQKERKDMLQEKWSEDKESELKGCEEEEVSEKVTGVVCRPLECGAAPLIALPKTEYKHLFLISNSRIKANSKAW